MENSGSGGERESVRLVPEEIVAEEPKIKTMKARVGLNLCKITIIGLVVLESVVVIAYFLITWHSLGSIERAADQELLQSYKEARSAIADDVLKIGEQFLGKLLPVITLLLGYMFGSRGETAQDEGD